MQMMHNKNTKAGIKKSLHSFSDLSHAILTGVFLCRLFYPHFILPFRVLRLLFGFKFHRYS
jgi:hypothetical protein